MTLTQVFELGLFFSLPTYTMEQSLLQILFARPVIFIAGRSVNVHLMLAFWVCGGSGDESNGGRIKETKYCHSCTVWISSSLIK